MKDGKALYTERYDSIQEIDKAAWDSIVPCATGLRHDVLHAVEASRINELKCSYLLFNDISGQPTAKANLYQVNMDLTTLDPTLSPTARQLLKLWSPGFLTLSMIECGLFAMNGDGLVSSDSRLLRPVIEETAATLQLIADQRNLDLLVVRDVPLEHFDDYRDVLSAQGFYPTAGFANTVLDLNWRDLNEYFADLNSKDRYKLKNALRIEEKFDITVNVTQDYDAAAHEMAELWKYVNQASKDYSREHLDESFFHTSACLTAKNTEVIMFRHRGQLVAFMWNLVGDDDYHMADWGVDYTFPRYRDANLYRTASVVSLRRALELGKKRMQLGMTNYGPKKLLGAHLQPLVYFIKHRSDARFSRALAGMMTAAIEQPEPLAYYTPSKTWPQSEMTAAEYRARLSEWQVEHDPSDVFSAAGQPQVVDILKLGGLYPFYPLVRDDGDHLDLAGNSHLGLQTHPHLKQAIAEGANRTDVAITSGPVVSGVSQEELLLSQCVATQLHQQSALVCQNGSIAHGAIFDSIVSKDAVIFMDEQNDPVLWAAARAGGADVIPFEHRNYAELMSRISDANRPSLIVSQSVFSMFGDRADLRELAQVRNRTNARLYIDETYSYGLMGPDGAGLCVGEGIVGQVDIIVGAFSHTLGLEGGYVAGSTTLIEYIKDSSTVLQFSNRITRPNARAITLVLENTGARVECAETLLERSRELVERLSDLRYKVVYFDYPIISIVFGDMMLALLVQKRCRDQGLSVSVMVPPLVPEDLSGIRLSLHGDLARSDVERVSNVFKDIKRHTEQASA